MTKDPNAIGRPAFVAGAVSGLAALAAGIAPATGLLDEKGFLALSKAITGHSDLDATVAAALFVAMNATHPGFSEKAATLARLATHSHGPPALLAAASNLGLRDVALAIVCTWYTGSTSTDPDAREVTYEKALMFRPAIDAIPIQTFCTGEAGYWTRKPPPLGIPIRSESES